MAPNTITMISSVFMISAHICIFVTSDNWTKLASSWALYYAAFATLAY